MSREYRKDIEKKYEEKIKTILKDAPYYIKDFYNHMYGGKREISTQFAYIFEILDFIKYEQKVLQKTDTPIKEFPFDVFLHLTVKDMNEYRSYLYNEACLSNSSIKKKFAAISAFYKFLNTESLTPNNPLQTFELPVVNKHKIVKLDRRLSDKLLSGILQNDSYLTEIDGKSVVLKIPEDVWIKREPLVLRNYAICSLFLGAGLRVSELVGLDLSDVSFYQNSLRIIAKGGDETEVYFGAETAAALKEYIYGINNADLEEVCEHYAAGSSLWCKENILDFQLSDTIKEKYPEMPFEFYKAITLLSSSYRRKSRENFNPKRNCNAVFVTSRGTRMSVRMVEIMIKEMVKTYLPDYDDKNIFSPHKLRATCATRILMQTGDIKLASTQLNHKGIEVTSEFYSEITKSAQKQKIQKLDIHNW